jgi:hypothetical protein
LGFWNSLLRRSSIIILLYIFEMKRELLESADIDHVCYLDRQLVHMPRLAVLQINLYNFYCWIICILSFSIWDWKQILCRSASRSIYKDLRFGCLLTLPLIGCFFGSNW